MIPVDGLHIVRIEIGNIRLNESVSTLENRKLELLKKKIYEVLLDNL